MDPAYLDRVWLYFICVCHLQRRLIDRLIEKLIQISIIDMADHPETEKTPVIRKVLNRVQACPDNTHVRLFFDQTSFLAIPFSCKSICNDSEFHAFDLEAGLHYHISVTENHWKEMI
jgi:hypothetical protein